MRRKYKYWVALPFSVLLSTVAHAAPDDNWSNWFHQLWLKPWGQYNSGGGGGNSVPELDGATGPLAVALVAGIIGIAIERKRRQLNKV